MDKKNITDFGRFFSKLSVFALILFFGACSGRTYHDALYFFSNLGSDSVPAAREADRDESLEILRAVPENPTRLKLYFSKAVELSSSELMGNYSIVDSDGNRLLVTGVTRDPNDTRVVYLNTGVQVSGKEYTVTITGVGGVDGSKMSKTKSSVKFTGPDNVDNVAPVFHNVSSVDTNKVLVTFSEVVDAASVLPGNFTICSQSDCTGANITISSVKSSVGGNGAKVELTAFSALSSSSTYYLRANGVKDRWGNEMVNVISFGFKGFISPAAPRVLSAISNSTGSLVITFDQEMERNASIVDNTKYETGSSCPSSTSLNFSGSTVTYAGNRVVITGLTGGPATSGNCTVSVSVSGIRSKAVPHLSLSSSHNSARFYYRIASGTGGDSDTSSPNVVTVSPKSATQIEVIFSEPVNASTGSNLNNYVFNPTMPSGSSISCAGAICTVNIPSPGQADTDYTVTISGVTDSKGNSSPSQTFTFKGDSAPYIKGIYPLEDGTYMVEWSEPIGSGSTVNAGDYTVQPGGLHPDVAALYPSGVDPSAYVKLSFNTPLTAGSDYRLEYSDVAPTGSVDNTGNPTNTVIPDGAGNFRAPSIPVKPSLVTNGVRSTSATNVLVTFSEPLNNSSISASDFSLGSGGSCPSVVSSASQVSAGKILLTVVSTAAGANESCNLSMASGAVSDLLGNTNDAITNYAYSYTGTGTADLTGPMIVSVTSISNRDVKVYFSESIDASSVSMSNFNISPSMRSGVTSSVSCSGSVCTLAFGAPGQEGILYTMAVSGIKDLSGNLMNDQTVSFGGIGGSSAQPEVFFAELKSPSQLEVSFTESISEPGASTIGNYLISGSNTVTSAVRMSDSAKVLLTFSPGAYGSSNDYTVTVSNVTDLSGNPLGTKKSYTFKGGDFGPNEAPELAAADITGSTSANGTSTTTVNEMLTFTGRVSANTSVIFYIDSTAVLTKTSGSDGSYLFDYPSAGSPLADGSYKFSVRTVAANGLVSSFSPYKGVVIVTTAPADPTSAATLATASDTGHSNSDGVTNINTPRFSGSGLHEGDIVVLYSDNPSANTEIGKAIVGSGGSWSWTLTPGDTTFSGAPANQLTSVSSLTEGNNNITYKVENAAGSSGSSPSTLVVVDTVWGGANPTSAASLDAATDTGISQTDGITHRARPEITGTGAVANEYVYIYDGTTLIGSTQVDGSGNWSYTPSTDLSDGSHSITYHFGDLAGNLSSKSGALEITIDRTAPATPATSASLSASSDTGISSSDGITSETRPTLSGSGLTAGDYVVIYSDNPTANTELGKAKVDSSGNWSWTLTPGDTTFSGAPVDQVTTSAALSSGTHNISYKAMDVAGNESSSSPSFALVVDTAAPSAPSGTADLHSSTDSGNSNSDNITNNNNSIRLSGASAVANSLVRIYSGSTEIGQVKADGSGNWSWTMTPGDNTFSGGTPNMATLVSSLSDGTNNITYKTESISGVLSPASSGTLAMTVDTSAPTHSSSSIVANSYITINLSEGIYGGDGSSGGAVSTSDFSFVFAQNGGTATGASISSVTNSSGGALSGGEDVIRVYFSLTGSPNGDETITVSAASNSVYDNAGNASSFTTGAKNLTVAGVASINNTPSYTPLSPTTGGTTGYIDLTWSEGVYTNSGANGVVNSSDFSVSFTQNSGNSTAAVISCITTTSSTSCPGTSISAGATSMRLHITNTGVSSGSETIQVNVQTNAIFSSTSNATPNTVSTGQLTFPDRLAPTVTNVTSSTANGTYKTGDTISIQVVFSETVNVVGTPTLTLSTGNPVTTSVNYVSGSGSDTLSFTYTVANNNLSSDLDYSSTSALSAGTTIRDDAGNDANRTLASPGSANSLGANKALVIDGVRPSAPASLSLASSDDTGSSNSDRVTNKTSGLTISGTAEASSTVKLYKTNSSGSLLATLTANASGAWTGDISLSEGVHSIVATATDAAGNVSPDSSGLSITVDTTAPSNQNTVFASSAYRQGSVSVTIVSSGASSNEVWFAPSGTTSFTAGNTMTKASSGTATSLNAPTTAGTYKLYVIDLAGNISSESTATLTVDNVAPVISSVSPSTNSYVKDAKVSYTLSEDCGSASVKFTRTGGAADAGSPHTAALTGSELSSGTNTNITLTNNPSGLVSGALYSVEWSCTDLAGNAATAVTSTAVHFDNTAPVISSVSPASNATINNTLVGYTLSEICDSGKITWSRTGGNADASAPHVKTLSGAELNAGSFSGVITNNPTLSNGTIYTISWDCTDRAGNTATSVSSTSVTFNDVPLAIVSAQTMDTNNNGKIDTYRVAFNKNVKDDTFPGYVANGLGSVTSDWLVAGYTNVRLIHGTGVSFATDTPNDSVIYIRFTENLLDCDSSNQVGCDTGAKPDLTTSSSPALKDLANATISQVNTGDVTESDGAKPILVGARSLGATKVDVFFSEPVGQTISEDITKYSINNGITVSAASRDATDHKTVHLTTSNQTGGTTYTLTGSTDIVDMANFNLNASKRTASFDGLVKPVVASIVTTSATSLKITFNESIVASTAECGNITTCGAIYENISLPVLKAVSTAGSGNNSASFTLTVNPMIEGQAYTTKVKENTAQSVSSTEKMGSTNNSATFNGDGKPAANISSDTATACPANGPNKRVVVQYSEAVSTGVSTVTNYKITRCVNSAEPCATGTGSPNSAGAASVTSLGGNKYAVDFTDSFDTDSSEYELSIVNVEDGTGNTVPVPTKLTFRCGNDQTAPSLMRVSVVSTSNTATVLLLTFSESVDNVSGNLSTNYKYDTKAYGVQVNSAARQGNSAQVQVTFAPGLLKGGHQLIVRNVKDLAGNTIIENGVNNAQPFIINAPNGFAGGAVFDDPFGDGTPAGMIIKYDDKLYLGADKNATKLFEVDLALTQAQSIVLDADGNASMPYTSFKNYASTNSGTLLGVDTIYAACTGGTSTPTMSGSACTAAGGIEKMFIGSLNNTGFYKSIWHTANKSVNGNVFTFSEQLSGDTGGNQAYRTMNMLVFKDYLYVNFGAEGGGGGRGGRICMNSSGCAGGNAYLSTVNLNDEMVVHRIGALTATNATVLKNGSNTSANYRDPNASNRVLTAINVMYEHDNDGSGGNESQLYLANGGYYTGSLGSARTGTSDGGILRTKVAYSAKNTLRAGGSCNSDYNNGCLTYYDDITPDGLSKWNAYLSTPYPQNSAVTGAANCSTSSVEMDCTQPYNLFVPAMKAIPYMRTAPNGDLYLLRNACSTKVLNTNRPQTGMVDNFRTEKQVCPIGDEVPQLWMMEKNCGTDVQCRGKFHLVAEYGSTGKTNMAGNTSDCGTSPNKCEKNSHLTLLEFLGNYMYIGYDNKDHGANVWRVNMSSVPTGSTPAQSAFEIVNVPGIDSTATNQKMFSHITYKESGKDWLIIITRDGSSAVRIYRTSNDSDP